MRIPIEEEFGGSDFLDADTLKELGEQVIREKFPDYDGEVPDRLPLEAAWWHDWRQGDTREMRAAYRTRPSSQSRRPLLRLACSGPLQVLPVQR